MTSATSERDRSQTHGRELLVLEWLLGGATAWVMVVPRSTPFVVAVLAIGTATALAGRLELRQLVRPSDLPAWLWAIAAVLTWAAMTTLWSPVPLSSLAKPLQVAMVVTAAYVTMAGMARLHPDETAQLSRAIMRGLLLGLAFLATEEVTGLALEILFSNHVVRVSSPTQSHLQDGEIVSISLVALNRNMVLLSQCAWPVLAWLMIRLESRQWRALASLALALVVATVLIGSEHKASKATIGVATATFLLAWAWPRAGLRAVMAAWVGITLLMLPAAKVMDHYDWEKAQWLFSSARDRVFIWSFTANEVAKSPIVGVGADATPFNDQQLGKIPDLQGRLGRHSHNVFVQTWYELGGIGAVLMCIMGLMFLRTIGRIDERLRPIALAQFTAFTIIAASAFGLWQIWFSASLALSAVLWSVVTAYAAKSAGPAGGAPAETRALSAAPSSG
jgi:O-antigen ligase